MKTKNKININLLAIILLLGLGLRLINLNQSFWLDEAISAKVAQIPFSQIGQFIKGDFNPPLYYYIINLWENIFGASEFSLRIPSLVFGLGAIWLTFMIGRFFLDKHAKLAALLLATAPLHIYYSQEARAYSLTVFTVLTAAYFFIKSLKNKKYWICFAFFLPIMVFSHYQSLLFLPVFGIIFWWENNKKNYHHQWRTWQIFLISFSPLLMLFLFYWPIFQKQLTMGQGSNIKNFLLLPIKFVIGRIDIGDNILHKIIVGTLTVFFWALAGLGTIKSFRHKRLFFPTACFLPLTIGIGLSFFLPIFSYFRFLYLLPFFYLLVIEGLKSFGKKTQKIIFIILLTINLLCSFIYLFNKNYHRENWRLAVKILQENYPQQPVFIHSKINTAFHYYNNGELKTIDKDEFIHYNEVNLISYGLPIFDPDDKIREKLKDLNFNLTWGDSFNRVGVEKWKKQI